ncbi:ribosomal protein L5 domain-containing protein [Chytriomyces sp. MP71]|nr:ribosomal protein L5 domain-containing protein [Chytriomyces sp. MP71]
MLLPSAASMRRVVFPSGRLQRVLRVRSAVSTAAGDEDAGYLGASGIDSQAPVARARLEEHLFDTLVDDLLVLAYAHRSPLAPSLDQLDKRERRMATDHAERLSLTNLFTTPLAKLPTRPLDPGPPTTNLLSLKAARYDLYNKDFQQGRYRRRLNNIIDYTTIRDATFSKLDRLRTKQIREVHRGFEKHFSPRVDHLPALRKVVLKIWDEKTVNNKQILLSALLSLEAITGAPATPLLATLKDATKTIRVGMPIGASVTLHPPQAYEFLDKCTQTLLPRLREWPGISPLGANKNKRSGAVGFKIPVGSVGAFPDIEPHFDLYPQLFEIGVEVHTTAGSERGAVALLSGFQMPFRAREEVLAELKEAEALGRAKQVDDPFAKYKKNEKK